jgi:hypothetical protein
MSFKKVKVVMLPTNEKANALWWSGHKLYVKGPEDPSRGELNHLYFLSDEEIKEGDWYLVELFKITGKSTGLYIEKCAKLDDVWCNNFDVISTRHKDNCKKIIATTDKSLVITKDLGEISREDILPQPSQSFIEKFVEEYNKGNIITEVMVEYEVDYGYMEVKSYLKINPKDNTITIRKMKDSWSREEVIQLLKKLAEDIDENYRPYTCDNSIGFDMVNNDGKWIEENL